MLIAFVENNGWAAIWVVNTAFLPSFFKTAFLSRFFGGFF